MGDALLIEKTAQRRLADEYDAAQKLGEVRTQADIDREKFDEWVADERALFEEVADEVFYPDYDHLESAARQPRSGRVWSGDAMVRIAISVEGFEAIARTLPLGSMGCRARRAAVKTISCRCSPDCTPRDCASTRRSCRRI
jgi:hypothetical protein